MKIIKRIMATALVAAMSAASLAGCAKESGKTDAMDFSNAEFETLDCYSERAGCSGV